MCLYPFILCIYLDFFYYADLNVERVNFRVWDNQLIGLMAEGMVFRTRDFFYF